MRYNNSTLSPLEIEQVREAIRLYLEEYFSPVRYVVIDRIDNQKKVYNFYARCSIYFDADREFYADGMREDDFLLGIDRTEDGGFVVSVD